MTEGWEVLANFPTLNAKATRMMEALVKAAPEGTTATARYSGTRRNLMLYGPGSAVNLPIVRRHVKAGGHVAMWDLGYWERRDAMRLSIDTLHPKPEHIEQSPDEGRREFTLRNDASKGGPILLIGIGPKSVYAYDLHRMHQWELAKVAELRERFPRRDILWRPKGAIPYPLLNLPISHGTPIERALEGCSLLVCRHSNAAVDACIAGVPVECEDGAAFALYRNNPRPTPEERLRFLRRLTWWEWSRYEAPEAWAWIRKVVG